MVAEGAEVTFAAILTPVDELDGAGVLPVDEGAGVMAVSTVAERTTGLEFKVDVEYGGPAPVFVKPKVSEFLFMQPKAEYVDGLASHRYLAQ